MDILLSHDEATGEDLWMAVKRLTLIMTPWRM